MVCFYVRTQNERGDFYFYTKGKNAKEKNEREEEEGVESTKLKGQKRFVTR